MRRRGSPALEESGDDDSDADLFGVKRKADEEAKLIARRARIAASAIPEISTPVFSAPSNGRNTKKRAAADYIQQDEKVATHHAKRLKNDARNLNTNDDDIFDMFKPGSTAPVAVTSVGTQAGVGVDDAVEAEGYARIRPGETLEGGRYVVRKELGRGVFASVIGAHEVATGRSVAIKISRANPVMRRAASREQAILEHISSSSSTSTFNDGVIKLHSTFVHRNLHVALVFELMSCTLRDIIRQHSMGVRLSAVRIYAVQLLNCLAKLSAPKVNVIHCDIKPDNVLVDSARANLRVGDFGCAQRHRGKGAEGPTNAYLAARYYRCPEIILGISPITSAIDMWSAGCVLFELYTGKVCFAGNSNREQLQLIQEYCGNYPNRMLRRAALKDAHFDEDGRLKRRTMSTVAPESEAGTIRERILQAARGDDEGKFAMQFANLVEAMLMIDPTKRIAVGEALRHPFFQRTVAGIDKGVDEK